MARNEVIRQALERISDDVWTNADRQTQNAQSAAKLAGRAGSSAHNSMLAAGAADAYKAGLANMVERVRAYAGVTASAYVDELAETANFLLDRLVDAHEWRLLTLSSGPYPEVEKHRAEFLGAFRDVLTTARDAAINDLQHSLADPEDALPWWMRKRAKNQAIGFSVGVVTTLVSGYLLKLFGLS